MKLKSVYLLFFLTLIVSCQNDNKLLILEQQKEAQKKEVVKNIMKKQTIFFYLLLVLFGVNSYSQNNKIEYVHLTSTSSIFIGAGVDISISTYKREKDYVDVDAQIGKKKFSTRITRNDYDDICKAILEISPKDIISIDKNILDGTAIRITLKNSSNDISYCVWGLSKNDQETSLKDFLKATKLILNVVHASGKLLEID